VRKIFFFLFLFLSLISLRISGQTWSALKRLTWNAGWSNDPFIAADSGSGIHVVWNEWDDDDTQENWEIYYKRSTDSGASWSGPVRLTWDMNASRFPSVVTDSGNHAHVVWQDVIQGNAEIFYKRSIEIGVIWSERIRLTWNAGFSTRPSIAADPGGSFHLVWMDNTPGNYEIFYKRSTDSGVSWSGLTRLTWSAGVSEYPVIATNSSGALHVAWLEYVPGYYFIVYKRSLDGGSSWSGPTRLNWSDGMLEYPTIAADSSGGVHVMWHDNTPGNYEIFYKRSTDSGATWSGLTRLTWSSGESFYQSITVDSSDGIHVVWNDRTSEVNDIYYKNSSDGGATWSVLTRLTWNAGESWSPTIAADSSGGIHIAWQDFTPGNYEIFYKNRK